MATTLLDPKSIRRISYMVEFLLIFNFTEFLVGLLIYTWSFDLSDKSLSHRTDWLAFSEALAKQDLPITARLLILLGSTGFVIFGGIGLSLYFGYQRSRWVGCFIGVVLGGSAFFVGRILLRNTYALYSVSSFFIIQSFSVIILNIFVLQLSLFTNLKNLKLVFKSLIIIGNLCIQVLFPISLVTDESGFVPKFALIFGWILSIGCYSVGRYLAVNSTSDETANPDPTSRVSLLRKKSRKDEEDIGSASDNDN